MTGSDSSQVAYLAGLCPNSYGDMVYRARALFTLVFDSLTTWNDDACISIEGGKHNVNSSQSGQDNMSKKQTYQLLPNPNTGNFVLQQKIADNTPVNAEILDVTGRVVYKSLLQFSNRTTSLHMAEATPGLYLLQLRDGNGNNYTLKFVMKE